MRQTILKTIIMICRWGVSRQDSSTDKFSSVQPASQFIRMVKRITLVRQADGGVGKAIE